MFQPHRNLSMVGGGDRGVTALSADRLGIRAAAPVIASASRSKALTQPEEIQLDYTAPIRAIRNPTPAEAARKTEDSSLRTVDEEDERTHPDDSRGKGKDVARPGEPSPTERPQEEGPVWGAPFKVEWVRSHRLPFTRTRHLRNPWNHDREVKVSRDGTELEPAVGQMLLEEWDRIEPPEPQTPAASVDVGRRLHGKASISADVLTGVPSSSQATVPEGR